jgi:hypothetical protein
MPGTKRKAPTANSSPQKRRRRVRRPKPNFIRGKDYRMAVTAPTAQSSINTTVAPVIATTTTGSRIKQRELLTNVVGNTAYLCNSLVIQPGLTGSFPWLSYQASGWDEYRFHNLSFEFVPSVSTATAGQVLLTPYYDVLDAPPSNETEASEAVGTREGPPWQGFSIQLDMKAMFATGPRKFIRQANVATDRHSYDGGTLHISTIGMAASSVVGRLYANYDIEFFKPKTGNYSETLIPTTVSSFIGTAASGLTSGSATIINVSFGADSSDVLSVGSDVGGYWTPAAGSYLLTSHFQFQCSSTQEIDITYQWRKNNTPIGINQGTNVPIAVASAANKANITTSVVVSCSGTDVLSCFANCTFSGTAIVDGSKSYVVFQVV